MIFITLGSREYQFNRLLQAVDDLIARGDLKEEVFAQIGQSDYEPKLYKYERYLASEEFKQYQNEADLIISHGGTGALVSALKLRKQVIAVPRLAKYGEHIDDHQLQVTKTLESKGYLLSVYDMAELYNKIKELKESPIEKIYNEPSLIKGLIVDFLENDN